MEFKTQIKFGQDDMKKFYINQLKEYWYVVLASAIMFGIVAFKVAIDRKMSFFCIIGIFILLYWIMFIVTSVKAISKLKGKEVISEIILNDNGYIANSDSGNIEYSYDRIERVVETEQYFQFVIDKRTVYFPKYQITEEKDLNKLKDVLRINLSEDKLYFDGKKYKDQKTNTTKVLAIVFIGLFVIDFILQTLLK